MSLRGQLKSIHILLEAARKDPTRFSPEDGLGLAERLVEVIERIERQPQLGLVRPALIALHNLVMSLRRPEISGALPDELDAALEAGHELLADPMFGFTIEELRAMIRDALATRGVAGCVVCRHPELELELVHVATTPFAGERVPAHPALPNARVTCQRCGATWMHDLGVLGVIGP